MPSPFAMLPKSRQSSNGSGLIWREKLKLVHSIRQFLRLAWETHRGCTTATVLLRLLRAAIPLAALWMGKLIIDIVVSARVGRPDLSRLWLLVGVELVIVAGPPLHAQAQVIMLDEPTSALDVRAEYETFVRFAELVSGQIALLISHRFSTVRMADRIVVLQQGTVLEQGTHEQLLSNNSLYAELFRFQVEGYQ